MWNLCAVGVTLIYVPSGDSCWRNMKLHGSTIHRRNSTKEENAAEGESKRGGGCGSGRQARVQVCRELRGRAQPRIYLTSLLCSVSEKCSPVEEGVPERVELPEGFLGVDHQGVAGDDALCLAVHHRDEAVGGRLRSDPHPWKILFQQIPGEEEREGERGLVLRRWSVSLPRLPPSLHEDSFSQQNLKTFLKRILSC